jgi:hypothetical protein
VSRSKLRLRACSSIILHAQRHYRDDAYRVVRIVTYALLALNAALLLWSLRDYRVSIDSGYHVSLARWYAAHGTAWWDHINFGPGGRPNLQGPALHIAIALFGKILGGTHTCNR